MSKMAAKDSAVDKKRKAPATMKGKFDKNAKKPRVDSQPASQSAEDSDSFEEFSDDEEGGVKLEQGSPKKGPSDGKAFEKEPGQTSREAHAKQKQLALERKAAKPLADEVSQIKKIWERLRLKTTVTKDERQKLVDELFSIFQGRMREFTLKHDTVRAVQSAVKHATPEQKRNMAKELKGSYVLLAESRYAKFLIGKLLVQDDDEIRDMIIPEFYGKVRKMINHPEASWILDDIYRTVATKEQKAMLLREWYGPEFAIREMVNTDEAPTADLKEILEKEPGKRAPIMKSLFTMSNALVQKGMTGFTMLHDAMLQYFLNTQEGSTEFNEFSELVKGDEAGDLLKNLAFTRSGSRLACLLLAHGTAKDRKVYLKAYKEAYQMMSNDQYAHLVLLTAMDVVDDTRLSAKSIFSELLGEGDEIAQNVLSIINGRFSKRVLLYPFESTTGSLFHQDAAFALEIINEIREIRKTTSKKDEDVRRKEIVAAVAPHLLGAIVSATPDLIATNSGTQLIVDVLFSYEGDKQQAMELIAELAGGDPMQKPEDAAEGAPLLHVSQTPWGSRMLKSLIQGGPYNKEAGKVIAVEPALNFAEVLYPVIQEHVVDWATSKGSFVIVSLAESETFSERDALKKTLTANKKKLESAATTQYDENKGQKKKNGSGKKGNVGSKVLLEAL